MAEALSPGEVGSELQRHQRHAAGDEHDDPAGGRHHRALTVIEAALLAIVAVMAAYSSFASAKWSTESSLDLAKANSTRAQANRVAIEGYNTKNFDSLTFNAWFDAYADGNQVAETVAERRFRPQFRVAFNAWMATDPFTNPKSPPGPTYMPQYVQPGQAQANHLDNEADHYYDLGVTDGHTADNYVLIVVYLATVLFLVGISSHFQVRAARIGLVVVGGGILVFGIVLLVQAPKPTF